MSTKVCKNCRYWSLVFGESRYGECRRYAPHPIAQMMPEEGELETYWASFPVTPDGAWCGDFEDESKT